jgi:hypothetical protein
MTTPPPALPVPGKLPAPPPALELAPALFEPPATLLSLLAGEHENATAAPLATKPKTNERRK